MAIVNTHYGYCAVGGALPKFTYTGMYNVREDGVVELLTSGTIVFLEPKVIDLFMVGGGGAGGLRTGIATGGGGGGGGGFTRTDKKISVTPNVNIPVVIGAGGEQGNDETIVNGKPTSWGELTVNGGNGVRTGGSNSFLDGANGGSGGGGYTNANSDGGSGGSDGGSGETGLNGGAGGTGQGSTTREFGELKGKLYAGGGGGGRFMVSNTPVTSAGGSGGGGTGSWVGNSSGRLQAAAAGVANTGGGGGGGSIYPSIPLIANGASGGSGIVCFRAAR